MGKPGNWPRRGVDLLAGSLLLAAVLALFLPAVVQPDDLLFPTYSPYSDLTVIHWPKANLMARVWSATGSLPLWTPANLSGMPLAANQLAMRFYPPAWLLVVLPTGPAFNVFLLAHLLWAGLGLYWLLRRSFELDWLPALIGGLTFALCGKLLAHMAGGHISLVAAVAWMPWAFGAVAVLLRAPRGPARWRWAVLAGLALAMQIATHSQILLYTGYALAAYVVWEVITELRGEWRISFSMVATLAAIPLSGAALGAAQLLPLAEMAGHSNRSLSLAEAGEHALTPLSLAVALLLPGAQGGHEAVAYLGLVPLLLAAWGLSREDRRTWFLGAVVLVVPVFAVGRATPLFDLAYRFVPGMSWVRTPARAFFVAALAVAVLAGIGAQRLARGRVPWSNPAALAVGAMAAGVGWSLAAIGHIDRSTLGLALLPPLALLVARLAARRRLSPRWALPIVACLLFGDLLSFGLTMIRFVPPQTAFADGNGVAQTIAQLPGLFRTYSPSYSIPSHVAARAGIQTADGVDPIHLARYDRFMDLAGGYGDDVSRQAGRYSVTIPPFPPLVPVSEAFRGVEPDLRLLGLLNVEYLTSAFPLAADGLEPLREVQGTFVYRNRYSLPRAWVLPEDIAAPFLAETAESSWPQQLHELAEQAALFAGTTGDAPVVDQYQPDSITVEATLNRQGVLVLSENWYPGWLARVDGEPREVQPIAGLLRGVQMDAGAHQVVFVYNPLSVRIGTWVSMTAWLGLILAVAVVLVRKIALAPAHAQ